MGQSIPFEKYGNKIVLTGIRTPDRSALCLDAVPITEKFVIDKIDCLLTVMCQLDMQKQFKFISEYSVFPHQ